MFEPVVAGSQDKNPEKILVDMIQQDLGVVIEPQAFRMFLRYRWDRLAPLAHRIHEGKS
jgi:hypothetical protein